MNTHPAPFARLALALAALLLSSLSLTTCGGGGGSSFTPPPNQPAPLVITTALLPEGNTESTYSVYMSATGGTPPYSWSLTSDSDPLPSGITFSADGHLTGIPSADGIFNLTVRAQDSQSKTALKSLALKVIVPLRILDGPLPTGVINHPYSQALHASGGNPPYTWTLIEGTRPLHAGLGLSLVGVISGTPVESDYSRTISVQVQDSSSHVARSGFNLVIASVLEISTSNLPNANVWTHYLQPIDVSGGIYPIEMTLSPSSAPFPPGVSINNIGYYVIGGTPTTPGIYPFTLQVKDSGSVAQTATRELHLVIENHLVFGEATNLPVGVIYQPYAGTLVAHGGTLPYAWSLIAGEFPAGLALGATAGQITGTPTASGQFNFGARVSDSSSPPESVDAYLSFTVRPELSIRDDRLYDAFLTNYYGAQIIVDGGRPPISLRLTSGELPPGITQQWSDPTVAYFNYSGVPTQEGIYTFNVEATDSSSPPGVRTREFSIRVNKPLVFETESFPDGMTETPFTATLHASGGVLPYKWRIAEGHQLPDGLVLNSTTGDVSGTPTVGFSGSAFFWLEDSSFPPQALFRGVSLYIAEKLSISTSRIPPVKPSQPLKFMLRTKGGRQPFSYANISGNLPSGLILSTDSGLISGTPVFEGASNFTIKVTDSGPPVQTATKLLSMTITSDLGRNDSPATATAISNGTFRASISPYADPVAGPANPDNDYYALTASPGAVVTIETTARRLVPESFLDSVIEIVDPDGNRFAACRTPEFPYANYDQPCLNDDIDLGIVQDSRLEMKVPGAGTLPVTLYIHVFSFNGGARPDYGYDLMVSGAN